MIQYRLQRRTQKEGPKNEDPFAFWALSASQDEERYEAEAPQESDWRSRAHERATSDGGGTLQNIGRGRRREALRGTEELRTFIFDVYAPQGSTGTASSATTTRCDFLTRRSPR